MVEEKVSKAEIVKLLKDAPKSGFAEIVLRDPKKTGTITVRGYTLTDDEGNTTHRPFVDSNGNHRIVKYKKKSRLNLSKENDRLEYMQALLHPIYSTGPTPVFDVVNKEEEANQFIEQRDLTAEVNGVVQKLSGDELERFARILMVKFQPGSTPQAIKRAVYEKADLEPELVLNEWNDEDRPLKELIRVGVIKGKFSSKNGRWSCGGISTGTSFEQTIDWLKENEDLVPKLRKEIFGK